MADVTELGTERLILRGWTDADKAPFAAMNADPEVMEHFPAPLSREESDALADRVQAGLAERRFGLWAIEVRGTGEFVGFTGLSVPSFAAHFTPTVEIGWRLARRAWGRGIAGEAAREALRFGFEDSGLDEIVSFTARPNERSRVLMRRLSMAHDPAEDFEHPSLPEGHRLRRHVLYRLPRDRWSEGAAPAYADPTS